MVVRRMTVANALAAPLRQWTELQLETVTMLITAHGGPSPTDNVTKFRA